MQALTTGRSGNGFPPLPLGRWLLIGSLAVLAACGNKDAAKPAASTTTAPAAGASAEVVPTTANVAPATGPQLLASAKQAYGEDRLVAPDGDNAVEYYLAVKAKEENNIQAAQALVDLFPLGVGLAEKEIAARNIEEATRIIGLLDESSPGSYTVSKLKSRLASAQVQIQREDERRLASEQAAQQARTAAAAEVVAATPAPAAPKPAAPAPKPEPRPVEPEPAAVVTAAPTGPSKDAVIVRQVQPVYPAMALRRRLSGWVELRFTVGTDGKVSEVTVLRSDPARMFDREATRAVQQWLFEPALRNGVKVPTTLSRRIEFKQDN